MSETDGFPDYQRQRPVELTYEDETYWVVHPWGARLCLAVTFCAGMAIGALIVVIFVVVGR